MVQRSKKRFSNNHLYLNIVLAALSIVMVFPWIIVLITSIKAPGETMLNPGLIPEKIDLYKYIEVFRIANVPTLAINSVIITVSTVTLVLFISSLAAYAFARLDFILKEPLFFLILTGLMLQGASMMIPLYQVNVTLGSINSYLALIGPYVALGLPFSILIQRGFYESLPKDLEDAGVMDGASRFGIYRSIMLPLTKPALVTVGIFQGLAAWNDFLFPMLFLTKPTMYTLPLGLMAFQTTQITLRTEHIFALIVIINLPIVIVFLLMQRQFMSGMIAGAIKG